MTSTVRLQMALIAGLTALTLAASEVARPAGWSALDIYAYWICRLAIETVLFIGMLELCLHNRTLQARRWIAAAGAAALSFIPFVLAITALDIILGIPELDLAATAVPAGSAAPTQLSAFYRELGYLIDNHIFVSALISVPALFAPPAEQAPPLTETSPAAKDTGNTPAPTRMDKGILTRIEPPLDGNLIRAEAQEHYVKLVTERETRMVLYRFSDILHELPGGLGLQVHRSHWVAFDGVTGLLRHRTSVKLEMADGEIVPVSRKFASQAEAAFTSLKPENRQPLAS
ncbi:LytTR family DNA-binding domain-containing protein [Roseibium sp. RKSG952]|uniref:LytTR family DNA-binding domain-containing protein n=1 Tax=Roseibium sp. RKSG952 TaxID=2529384 RepID=UPI0018AD2326